MLLLPLFELFLALREPLKLRPDQYALLLEALEQGYGCEGIDDLKSVCRLLWLKSRGTQQEKQFETIFDSYIQQHTTSSSVNEEISASPHSGEERATTTIQEKQSSLPAIPARTSRATNPSPPPEIRLPSAYQTTPPIDVTQSESGYTLTVNDFPFLERPTRQAWRQLRQPLRQGVTTEIDIPATIQIIGRYGICLDPVRQPRRINQIELVFFQDCDGSMIPFRPIVDALFNTLEPRKFAQVIRYYFRNCPGQFVYLKPKGTKIQPLEDLPLDSNHTVAMIISDAGAARGGYNPQRVGLTKRFLEQIQPRVKALVWLNPTPMERWLGTTAEEIAELVDGQMFELPQDSLQAAIRCAKG
ncbi:MAG: hypothetical protein AB4426_11430 [Xenococcaceae cyanobacterium]